MYAAHGYVAYILSCAAWPGEIQRKMLLLLLNGNLVNLAVE